MNDKSNIYSLDFAAWELRLYLDTHPNDREALDAYKKLCAALGPRGCSCFGVSTGVGASGTNDCSCADRAPTGERVWSWIEDPWPWQSEANIDE